MFLERFFNYISFEKKYSAHTVLSYQTDINQYQDFLSVIEADILSATHRDVRNWVVSLMDDQKSSRTVNRKISALKTLYSFLLREELIEVNPMQKVLAPKIAKTLPVFLETEKLNALLDYEGIFEEGFEGKRDKLILEFLFGTGVRLSELLGLREKDVDFGNKTVKVLGKGNKERIIPMSESLICSIRDYLLKKKSGVIYNNSDALIVTNKGLQAYPEFIYRTVKRYLSIISSKEKKSPHVLRHTFATALLNAGADINAIKELLGHASLAATQVYTHNSIERIKTIYKQAHPKA
ncbi:integrase family protein [Pseudopedobacter saltans DSM 12145]|uniref:Tyrosine recombinase XerC n=1 Tax=Pseudopedobacter saltans (strain ATCC 51119 / DSM 12145 / JCM 21818 / CCUG 39354 / LMG 10337 / NBRC 100064 / NCIMB 13643) TaxID=762903 RepID=F0SCI8_PSESL|nr:tyrosine-type recombinase/integrase [Pseudopedobacter saltans]ADY52822.1 integrase family protein [Pseudopedobacter saltans DSM 12145]